ncbi:MAG: hypothetical protein VYD00_05335, partial [Pseudomonadota bacterium]|nr:hypothetical protein [Pseudomonadota bacterium]
SGSGRADPLSFAARWRWPPAPMLSIRVCEVTIGAAMEWDILVCDLALWPGASNHQVAKLLFRGKVSGA